MIERCIRALLDDLQRGLRAEALIQEALERGWDAERIDWLLWRDDGNRYRRFDVDQFPRHRRFVEQAVAHLLEALTPTPHPDAIDFVIPPPSPPAPDDSQDQVLLLDPQRVASLQADTSKSAGLIASAIKAPR